MLARISSCFQCYKTHTKYELGAEVADTASCIEHYVPAATWPEGLLPCKTLQKYDHSPRGVIVAAYVPSGAAVQASLSNGNNSQLVSSSRQQQQQLQPSLLLPMYCNNAAARALLAVRTSLAHQHGSKVDAMSLRDVLGRLGVDFAEKVDRLVRDLVSGRRPDAHSLGPFLVRVDAARRRPEGEACHWLHVARLQPVWYECDSLSFSSGDILTDGISESGSFGGPLNSQQSAWVRSGSRRAQPCLSPCQQDGGHGALQFSAGVVPTSEGIPGEGGVPPSAAGPVFRLPAVVVFLDEVPITTSSATGGDYAQAAACPETSAAGGGSSAEGKPCCRAEGDQAKTPQPMSPVAQQSTLKFRIMRRGANAKVARAPSAAAFEGHQQQLATGSGGRLVVNGGTSSVGRKVMSSSLLRWPKGALAAAAAVQLGLTRSGGPSPSPQLGLTRSGGPSPSPQLFDSSLSTASTTTSAVAAVAGASRAVVAMEVAAAAGRAAATATVGQQPKGAAEAELQPLHGVAGGGQDYGYSSWQRMGMVLSALETIVTAFAPSGNSVYYQNASSIAYYGPRPASQAAGTAAAASNTAPLETAAAHGAPPPSSPAAAGGGPSGLAQLFALEPLKLDRMLAEVGVEGRTWKGIVQVPSSCARAAPYYLPLSCSTSVVGLESHLLGVNLPLTGESTAATAAAAAAAAAAKAQQSSADVGSSRLKQGLEQRPGVAADTTRERWNHAVTGPPPTEDLLSDLQTIADSADTMAAAPENISNHLSSMLLNNPESHDAVGADMAVGMDVDPLATSTWGLMLDTEPYPISSFNRRSSLRSLIQLQQQQQGHQLQPQLQLASPEQSTTGLQRTPPAALGGGDDTITAAVADANTAKFAAGGWAHLQLSMSSARVGPQQQMPSWGRGTTGPSGSSGKTAPLDLHRRQQQRQQQHKQPKGEPSAFSSSSGATPIPCTQQPSMTHGTGRSLRVPVVPGSVRAAKTARSIIFDSQATIEENGWMASSSGGGGGVEPLRRTASVTIQGASLLTEAAAASRNTLLRSASRGDMSLQVGTRSSSRVLTFASSLRNTPAALQAAVAAPSSSPITAGPLSGRAIESFGNQHNSNLTVDMNMDSSGGSGGMGERSLASITLATTTRDMEVAGGCAVISAKHQQLISTAASGIMRSHTHEGLPCEVKGAVEITRANPTTVRMTSSGNVTPLAVVEGASAHAYQDAMGGGGPCCPQLLLDRGALRAGATAASADVLQMPARVPAAATTICPSSTRAIRPTSASAARSSWSVRSRSRRGQQPYGAARQLDQLHVSGPQAAAARGKPAAPAGPSPPTNTAASSGLSVMSAALGFAQQGVNSGQQQQLLLLPHASQRPQPSIGGSCWHEVTAIRAVDPLTGSVAIVVTQTDVTAKILVEKHLAFVAEAEHRLLEQIFPRHVLAHMTEEGGVLSPKPEPQTSCLSSKASRAASSPPAAMRDVSKLATSHPEVTLLFADIQGFTPMCQTLEPQVVMTFLNDLFTRFDRRLEEFGVYKVETIGDCYFVAGGLIEADDQGMPAVRTRDSRRDPLHAESVLLFAKAMLSASAQVRLPTTGGPVKLRIGIHSGPVVSGVVGECMPRFCLFGDTVNTASRMESTGLPGAIHASEAARKLLPHEDWVPTGGIEVKGKGRMLTYLLSPGNKKEAVEAAARMAAGARTPDGRSGGGGGNDNCTSCGASQRKPPAPANVATAAGARPAMDAAISASAVRSANGGGGMLATLAASATF